MVASIRGSHFKGVTIGQVVAPPPDVPGITLRTTSGAMQYWTEYNNVIAGDATGAQFNTSIVPTGAVFVDGYNIKFALTGPQSVIGNQSMADGSPFFVYITEFKINVDLTSKVFMVGLFPSNALPFVPNSNYGGVVTWYDSQGYVSSTGGVNLFDTYSLNDAIGLIYEPYGGNIWYLKNGVVVANTSPADNVNYIMAGFAETPYTP